MGVEFRDVFDTPSPTTAGAKPGAVDALTQGFRDVFDSPRITQPPIEGGGDGSTVGMPGDHVIPYDLNAPQIDDLSTSARPGTVLKASMVPETDLNNQKKRIRIIAQDMGIPESRFFYQRGDIKYIDDTGKIHAAVPTIGGGSLTNPADMLGRVGAQAGYNAGPLAAAVTGGAAATVGGPAVGAAVAGVTDLGRQALGNYFADAPIDDLSYSNAGWQALGVGAGEMLGQIGSSVAGWAMGGKRFYNLRDGEVRQLQQVMKTARDRAQVAQDLGLHTTPYDLTDLPFFKRLETTVSKQGGTAGDIMQDYYLQRSEVNFPGGIAKLLDRISPEGTPSVGWDKLKQGAENTIAFLRNNQTRAGNAAGWGEAIGSGARPDVRSVVAEIRNRIGHTSGVAQEQLEKLLGELYTPARGGAPGTGALVTDYEKLHNIRLDLEGTLDGLRTTLPPSERGRLSEVLDPIYEGLNTALETAHPAYARGTTEYQLRGAQAAQLRNGVLTLASKQPGIQEKLGGMIFNSDAKTITEARQMFASRRPDRELERGCARLRRRQPAHLRRAEGVEQLGGQDGAARKP
jgi:hypothetical protein